ncbi:response regulator [Capilliphycus salinus ALCB114379]|uniref:response regulator n=1 Tax=Capilliphycus salinus TaxID=2768948 RepID=UPI0039A7013E
MRILLVEDDKGLAQGLEDALIRQRYVVDLASDGLVGWELAEALTYDLILLDLLLPKLDGINFCKRLRNKGDRTPVLLMTAQNTADQKVEGLDAGADDYLVKPFELSELLARIRALLRRGNSSSPPILEWGGLRLDPKNCQVTYCDKLLKLTAKEYELLELFLRHPERIFSQNALLDHLWSFDDPPSESAVRTQIKGLRQKLKQSGVGSDLIETVYGLGYRLKSVSPPNDTLTPPEPTPAVPRSPTSINLSTIWKKHRESYLTRIAILEQATKALETGPLDRSLQQQALEQAHTLAGSLGSFGFGKASQYCRQIEQMLNGETQLSAEKIMQLSALLIDLNSELSLPPPASVTPTVPLQPTVDAEEVPNSLNTRLLIVDDDLALAEGIATVANTRKIYTEIAVSPQQARKLIAENSPDIVLLDLSFPDSTEAGFELLEELNSHSTPLPVVVFTAKESFADRVKVARLGGRGFLQKPISPPQVLDAITRVLSPSSPPRANILIVDNEAEILDRIRSVLEPWGFHLILLDNPQQFWQTLEQSTPELLILDFAMPDLSGVELCQVVRNDPRWQDLPIIILSEERNRQIVERVWNAGADDYIQKPLVEPELIARVLNCLERSQLRRKITGD